MAMSMRSALVARPCVARTAFRPALAPVRMVAPVQRTAVQVSAMADEKKAQKKRTPYPVKRAQLAESKRMFNKSRKSACATRIKKVIKLATELMASSGTTEETVKQLEQLISEAYKEIDKAVQKGILHENTGARKKARCARYKRTVLMASGMWTPPADHPEFARCQKLRAVKAA